VSNGGLTNRNGSQLDLWLAHHVLLGWAPQAIAVAVYPRISLRTAQRWCAEVVDLGVVEFGGYTATFAIRRTLPPMRLTPWEPV